MNVYVVTAIWCDDVEVIGVFSERPWAERFAARHYELHPGWRYTYDIDEREVDPPPSDLSGPTIEGA